MNFAVHHPVWFLGVCGVLMLQGWQVYKAQRFLCSIQPPDAVVIPLFEEAGDDDF